VFIIEHFDVEVFLANYWQKKPCLIKQFQPNFADPIDENDLAGLAQEDEVDSRIVSNENGVWQVSQGPFTEFELACKGSWSLLVQGVDRYIPEVDSLSQLVSFIPHWRFDDVMVSYSNDQAGVGAHTDEYDVFILQGKGKRRWQVGLPSNAKTLIPHPLLKQIEGFEAVIDEVLMPGDAIYIPPKHPHNGVALEACMNYSMGFRAPTNLEVLTGLLDESDNINEVQTRYTDSDIASLRPNEISPMEVSAAEIDRIKESISDLLNSSQANQAIMHYLSRQALAIEQESTDYSVEEIQSMLDDGEEFTKLAGVKAIFSKNQEDMFSFYIDGNVFEIDQVLAEDIIVLLESEVIRGYPKEFTKQPAAKRAWVKLVKKLVNAGFYIS
jgi:50S ribosomal protein L16 3-hydroxylase